MIRVGDRRVILVRCHVDSDIAEIVALRRDKSAAGADQWLDDQSIITSVSGPPAIDDGARESAAWVLAHHQTRISRLSEVHIYCAGAWGPRVVWRRQRGDDDLLEPGLFTIEELDRNALDQDVWGERGRWRADEDFLLTALALAKPGGYR